MCVIASAHLSFAGGEDSYLWFHLYTDSCFCVRIRHCADSSCQPCSLVLLWLHLARCGGAVVLAGWPTCRGRDGKDPPLRRPLLPSHDQECHCQILQCLWGTHLYTGHTSTGTRHSCVCSSSVAKFWKMSVNGPKSQPSTLHSMWLSPFLIGWLLVYLKTCVEFLALCGILVV